MSSPFKPLNEVLDINAIEEKVMLMSIDNLIDYLFTKGVIIWQLNVGGNTIFVSKDFETRHRGYVWASQLGQSDVLMLFFNVRHGIKLYSESDLRKIAFGYLVHEAYQGLLKLSMTDVESEVGAFDPDLGIAGIADLVTTDAVIEIKSGRKSRRHLLQLAAYLRILRKNKGYLVYQDNVVEIQYDENVEQTLLKAVEEARRLRSLVSSSSLNYIIEKFKHDYERFKRRFGIEPSELLEALKNKGLA
jgi:hypothetical protein